MLQHSINNNAIAVIFRLLIEQYCPYILQVVSLLVKVLLLLNDPGQVVNTIMLPTVWIGSSVKSK